MQENKKAVFRLNEAIQQLRSQIEVSYPHAIKSGLKSLDQFTGGFCPGELCVIGSRPGMGKRTLVLSIISSMLRDKIPVALFSDTSSQDVNFMSRIISAIANVNTGNSYEQRVETIQNISLEDVPLYLSSNFRASMSSIRENAVKLKNENGIKCLFIESVQSLFDYGKIEDSNDYVENVCHELKILAQELQIPVIVTSELNRSPEHREGLSGKTPQLPDLRNSGAIECNADKVLLLLRPEYYRVTEDTNGYDLRGIMSIFIAKNKYGTGGVINVRFNPERCRVTDLD